MGKIVSVLWVLFLGVGCFEKKQTQEFDLKKTLRVNISTEPPTLDWTKSVDTTSALVVQNLMEGLVAYDIRSPELPLKPALAIRWEPADEFKTWVFHLRKGVLWSDGVEFKAQHVADGWQRLLDPKTASEYAYFLHGIKNAAAFSAGKVKDFAQVGVKVLGDHKIQVQLEKSQVFFPKLLAHTSSFPVRLDVIEAHKEAWTKPENMVGLGPYVLHSWEHDKLLVLKANERYYGAAPSVEYVQLYMVQAQSSALNMFNKKQLDAINTVPSVGIDQLQEREEFRAVPLLGTYYVGLNVKRAPLDDARVRKALAMAVSREEVTKMLKGGQVPARGFVPQNMLGYDPKMGVDFNPQKARELLVSAGYRVPGSEEGKVLPKLVFAYNTNEDHKRVAENIQAQLKRNLGVEVSLKNSEWKLYLASLNSKNTQDRPHMFRLGWLADYPDTDTFLSLFTSASDQNKTLWKNTEYDKWIEAARTEADPIKRAQLYKKAQEILTQTEVPVLPVYTYVGHYMVQKRVKDYPINALQTMNFSKVSLQEL